MASVASSPPRWAKQTRSSGCGATISNRSSAATQPASSWVQPTWSPDHRLDRGHAVAAQREPQLERPEAPAEGDLPVAVVDDGPGLAGRGAQVLGQDRQRAEQRGPVGHPEQVAVEVHAHPLVRVGAVRVGLVETGVDPAQLGAQRGDAAHGRRRRAARSPRAGRWRPARGTGSKAVVDVVPAVAHTKKGRRPAARSSAMAASSASGRMANAVVVGDDVQVVGADAGDAHALLDRRVGLRGRVGDETAGHTGGVHRALRRPLPRREDGAEGGLGRRCPG